MNPTCYRATPSRVHVRIGLWLVGAKGKHSPASCQGSQLTPAMTVRGFFSPGAEGGGGESPDRSPCTLEHSWACPLFHTQGSPCFLPLLPNSPALLLGIRAQHWSPYFQGALTSCPSLLFLGHFSSWSQSPQMHSCVTFVISKSTQTIFPTPFPPPIRPLFQ